MSQIDVQWVTPSTLHCEFSQISSTVNKAAVIGRCRSYLYRHIADKLIDIVPGFNELLVQFIPETIDYYYDQHTVQHLLQECLLNVPLPNTVSDDVKVPNSAATITRIAVDFSGDYDLSTISQRLGLSRESVITQFCAIEFSVILNGFMPGFVYLSGLPEHFHLPRLATPRLQVPAGAVAIADAYCGIYPQRSPGGWNLLGITKHVLFDITRPTPATFMTGDLIQFYPQDPLSDCDQESAADND